MNIYEITMTNSNNHKVQADSFAHAEEKNT